MKNEAKYVEINEIALNLRFYLEEYYKSLINQGFSVRWMTEDEINKESIFEIQIDKSFDSNEAR